MSNSVGIRWWSAPTFFRAISSIYYNSASKFRAMILFLFLLLTLTTNAIEIRFYGDDETCSKENLADTKFQDVSGTGCSG